MAEDVDVREAYRTFRNHLDQTLRQQRDVTEVSGSIEALDLDAPPILITKKRVTGLPFDGLRGPPQRLLERGLMHWIARREI